MTLEGSLYAALWMATLLVQTPQDAGHSPLSAPAAESPQEAAAWQDLLQLSVVAKQSRPPATDFEASPLNRDELVLVQACDRFGARYPDSHHGSQVQYMAAYVMYRANHLDDAIRRFRSVALAPRFEPDTCEVAASLWMDALVLKQDHAGLQRMLGEYRLSPCHLARRPPRPPVPAFKSVPSPDGRYPELDALKFLDGCWSYWNVDWGYTLCFHREGFEWLGGYESGGPMATASTTGVLISRDQHGVVFTSTRPLLERFTQGRLAGQGPARAAFGTAQNRLELMRDERTGELVLTEGALSHRLRPVATPTTGQ